MIARVLVAYMTCSHSVNTTLHGTPGKIDPGDLKLPPNEERPPAKIEEDIDEWFFIDRDALNFGDGWVVV